MFLFTGVFRYYGPFRTHTYAKEEPQSGGRRYAARGSLGQKVAELLEIPPDIVLDLPRVTMVGILKYAGKSPGIIEYTRLGYASLYPGRTDCVRERAYSCQSGSRRGGY